MKVLMFGWEFPPHISGGLGTACYGLTKGMSHIDDLSVTFVLPKAFGDEDLSGYRLIGAENVEVVDRFQDHEEFLKKIRFIEAGSNIIPYTDPEQYHKLADIKENRQKTFIDTSLIGKIKFSGSYGPDLFREIADYALIARLIAYENDHDIIHAHDWLTYPAGIAAKEVTGKPLVIHVHATDFDRSGGSVNPGVYEIEKRGMEAADKIIAVSNLTRNTIIEKYGINPNKVITVYNAVEPLAEREEIKQKKGVSDKIVTFLGRITLQKGPEYFVEAANEVLKKMTNVRFVMAGSGELLDKMIHRVASLGISDKFHFTGFLKGDDVYDMFAMSDLYVMPSVSEPFGISPLEAMQSNVPVIISHQSGVSEILKNAIKVDFWDTQAMADAIYGVLKYNGLSETFKKNLKDEVQSLKWENSAKKVKEVYEHVLQ